MGKREQAIATQLEEFREEHARGKADAFLRALLLCLSFDFELPTWLKDHLLAGALQYTQAKARTLDEALGLKRPKSWQLQQSQKQRLSHDLAPAACLVMNAKVRQGMSVEVALEQTCAFLDGKLSEATIKRCYYNKELRASLGLSQDSKKSEPDN